MNYRRVQDRRRKIGHIRLHIGVTEAGTVVKGQSKISGRNRCAAAWQDIGDTMRVSLTADPVEEVLFAKELLAATGIRKDRDRDRFLSNMRADQKWIWRS